MSINDEFFKWLGGLDYTGSFNDRWYRYLKDQSSGGLTPILEHYDTVVGVGASITSGVFESYYFDKPFRGVNFKSSAVGGANLQNMIDNVQSFIDLAEGRTLFLMHAGGNDCTTLTSPGGAADGDLGTVIDFNSVNIVNREQAESRYRELIGLLQPHGDLAVANLTLRDYKGQVLMLPNPASVGSGSWNSSLLEGLVAELTPDWFKSGKPVFDYYNVVASNPSILDADNIHMYSDRAYSPVDSGYPEGTGTSTLRKYMLKTLGDAGAIPPTPFGDGFSNRIRINIGNAVGVVNRPFYNGEGNNIPIEGGAMDDTSLVSYDDSKLTSTPVISLSTTENAFSSRINLGTNFLGFSEGLLDGNAMSSSISCPNNETFELKITNVGKGQISLAGLRQTTARDDSAYRTAYTITDDNGSVTKEVGSSWDGSEGFDQFAVFDYDTTSSGELTIGIVGVGSNGYGYIASICLDLE